VTHREVQQIAKNAIQILGEEARPGMTEQDLVAVLDRAQRDQGIVSYWFNGSPALLFAGEHRTVISLSVDDYGGPTDYALKDNDIITIDLSPEVDGVWSDYARTLIMQDGRVVPHDQVRDEVFREGLAMEDTLHQLLVDSARPDITFHELHGIIDRFLTDSGYENLDFLSNFGHSIVEGMASGAFIEFHNDHRIFFDTNNHAPLSSVRFFTFEPHIRRRDGTFGFKREDIYTFRDGQLEAI